MDPKENSPLVHGGGAAGSTAAAAQTHVPPYSYQSHAYQTAPPPQQQQHVQNPPQTTYIIGGHNPAPALPLPAPRRPTDPDEKFTDEELYDIGNTALDTSFDSAFIETTLPAESTANDCARKVNSAAYTIFRDGVYLILAMTLGLLASVLSGIFMAMTGFMVTYMFSPLLKMSMVGFRIMAQGWRFFVRMMCDPFFESSSRSLANIRLNLRGNSLIGGSARPRSEEEV